MDYTQRYVHSFDRGGRKVEKSRVSLTYFRSRAETEFVIKKR
jgi:hypothetical protein